MELQNSRCAGQMMDAHDIEGIFYAGTEELERFREESSSDLHMQEGQVFPRWRGK